MISSTTGHIIRVLGPYYSDSKNIDANIIFHGLKTQVEKTRKWTREDDLMFVDRDLNRDSLDFLHELDKNTRISKKKKKKKKKAQNNIQRKTAIHLG